MNPKQNRPRGRGNNGGNPNRGHSHGGGGGGSGNVSHLKHINVRTQVFDSNGPEGRIRGNAHQVMEKYLALARDASSQGDRVAAENFYQHAEHYFRLINAYNQNNGQKRPQNLPTPAEDQAEVTGDDEDGGSGEGNAAAPAEAAEEDGAEQQRVEQPRGEHQRSEQPRNEQPRGEQPRGEQPRSEQPRGEQQAPRRRGRPPAAAAAAAAETADDSGADKVNV